MPDLDLSLLSVDELYNEIDKRCTQAILLCDELPGRDEHGDIWWTVSSRTDGLRLVARIIEVMAKKFDDEDDD